MNTTDISDDVRLLRSQVHDANGLRRQEARLALIRLGEKALPVLIELLADASDRARWEAAEALVSVPAPEAAPRLVELLEDDSPNVRWAAVRALFALGRAGLPALFRGLTYRFESAQMRNGARHVLHALERDYGLPDQEKEVLDLLSSRSPASESVAWAAQRALEALRSAE